MFTVVSPFAGPTTDRAMVNRAAHRRVDLETLEEPAGFQHWLELMFRAGRSEAQSGFGPSALFSSTFPVRPSTQTSNVLPFALMSNE